MSRRQSRVKEQNSKYKTINMVDINPDMSVSIISLKDSSLKVLLKGRYFHSAKT